MITTLSARRALASPWRVLLLVACAAPSPERTAAKADTPQLPGIFDPRSCRS